jgi:hypothetical protein
MDSKGFWKPPGYGKSAGNPQESHSREIGKFLVNDIAPCGATSQRKGLREVVLEKPFCKRQLPHKSVDVCIPLVIVKKIVLVKKKFTDV